MGAGAGGVNEYANFLNTVKYGNLDHNRGSQQKKKQLVGQP